MFAAGSGDDMVTCPFDPLHQMLRKRLQAHIMKCRVNYPNVELRTCPINQTHLVRDSAFAHHLANCPDRKLIAQYQFDCEDEVKVTHAPIQSEDNWDDTDVQNYNPQEYAANSRVLRKPEGGQPAQRRVFVKEEHKRLKKIDAESK